MKLAIQNNHLGQILDKSPDPIKKGVNMENSL